VIVFWVLPALTWTIRSGMDPITQLQTRVEWAVTAVIDIVQLISGDSPPDSEKVSLSDLACTLA
jgi:hypothetical protein